MAAAKKRPAAASGSTRMRPAATTTKSSAWKLKYSQVFHAAVAEYKTQCEKKKKKEKEEDKKAFVRARVAEARTAFYS